MIESRSIRRTIAVACCFCFTFFADAPRATPLMDEARRLLDEGLALQAMETLAEEYGTLAGDTEFDFFFALSAIEALRPSLAIEPLQRIAAANPTDTMARALLARAYFILKKYDLAEAEFEAVKRLSPPDAVRQIINQYLAAIYAASGRAVVAERPAPTRWSGHVEFGSGMDSNANRATADSTIAVPFFGNANITLLPSATETSSAFLTTNVGGNVRHNISPAINVFGGVRINMLEWTADRASPFDQDVYALNGGAAWTRGDDTFSGFIEANWFTVDNDLFQRTVGGMLQWSRLLTQRSRINSFFRIADIEYHPRSQQSIRDVTRYLGGVGYTYIFGARGEVVVSGRVHAGIEDEQASGVEHLGRGLVGARLSADWTFMPDVRAFGAFAVEYSDYGDEEPLFLEGRNDTNYALSAGIAWNVAERWTVTPSIRYTNNDSDIPTSDYNSISGMVAVRFTF